MIRKLIEVAVIFLLILALFPVGADANQDNTKLTKQEIMQLLNLHSEQEWQDFGEAYAKTKINEQLGQMCAKQTGFRTPVGSSPELMPLDLVNAEGVGGLCASYIPDISTIITKT